MKARETKPGRRYLFITSVSRRELLRINQQAWKLAHDNNVVGKCIPFVQDGRDLCGCEPDEEGFELVKEQYDELEVGDMFSVNNGPAFIKCIGGNIRKEDYERHNLLALVPNTLPFDARITFLGAHKNESM